MARQQGSIRVHQDRQTVAFQVEGRGTVAQSFPLRRFAEQCLDHGAMAIRVDLCHCTYMDSTFLGTLLFLKRAADQREHVEFALICPSPQCGRLLHQMGVDDFFPIVAEEGPAANDWTELPPGSEEFTTWKRNVVQAHEALANLSGPAGEQFRAVMRCLEQAGKVGHSP